VDKGLINIKNVVDSSGKAFKSYLEETENPDVIKFIEELSLLTRVFIFSGVIRNFFIGERSSRDIDIVLESDVPFLHLLSGAKVQENSFGGFKIHYGNSTIDIWYLEDTWAFRNDHIEVFHFALDTKIPGTAFFNFSSVIYSFNERKFFYTDHFLRFLRDKEIDFVYDKNPNLKLCVLNTFYYSDKYNLTVKDRLKKLIVEIYEKYDKDYSSVQFKHYGRLIYSSDHLQHRVETIYYPRKKLKLRNTNSKV
jgi:hypothetical protein